MSTTTWDGTTGLVVTKLNGNYHFLMVAASGVVNRDLQRPLFFEHSGCQGRPYLPYDPSTHILPLALFDGRTLWAIDTRGAGNYTMQSWRTSRGCINIGQLSNVAAAPAVSTTMMFSGPLSLR
jgi:hypothetical protein